MHPYATFIPKDGSWFYIISEPYTGGDLTKLVASASEAQVKAFFFCSQLSWFHHWDLNDLTINNAV